MLAIDIVVGAIIMYKLVLLLLLAIPESALQLSSSRRTSPRRHF